MKPFYTTLLLVCFVLVCDSLQAQEKYNKVRIEAPADARERADLLALLQIDHFQVDGSAIIAEIGDNDLNKLRSTKYEHKVLIADVASHLKQVNNQYYRDRAAGIITADNKPVHQGGTANRMMLEQTGKTIDDIISTPSRFQVKGTFGGYYQFSEMETAINEIVTAFPAIASKTNLGTTLGGKTIWCVKISDNVGTDENEPELLYMGLQHAREAIGGSSMLFLMQWLCENYGSNAQVTDLVNNREIFIIPCMNPDGWSYNYTLNSGGGGGWRKNRKVIASGQYGVDLNRNWGIDWGNCAGASSSCGSPSKTSSNETYYGTGAFSELETQAVRAFTQAHHLVAMVDQHAYGPYYSLPFGRPSLHPVPDSLSIDEQRFYTRIPAMMGNYNGMRAGNSIQSVGYEVAGGVKDWMLKGDIGTGTKQKVYGMTGEGGAGGGTGGSYGDFWPPAAQIINLCKGIVFQDVQLALAAGSYVDLQDVSPMTLSSKTGTLAFKIRRIGLENQPVTITAVSLGNFATLGAPVTVSSLTNYYDTYSGTVSYSLPSSLVAGQRVRFQWKIQTGNMTYYDTVTKFYSPIAVFSDNMEGTLATNWTVSGGGWAYSTDDAHGGTHNLSESPNANYTASSTRTITYSGATAINTLSSTAVWLSFWVKHRAENFQDKLQVQTSIDNGTTWVAMAGTTTVQEPGTLDGSNINGKPSLTGVKDDWVRELFDLSSLTRVASLRLRFQFTSDANSSFYYSQDDGFHIDDIELIKSNTTLLTLPVHFVSFTGRLQQDETVRLDWVAITDNQHDHFEVEKSSDGVNFIGLGNGPATAPYFKIDPSPYVGNNYYRIKQVDKDGAITYSSVVNIIYAPKRFSVQVYPNPVTDFVKVKITAVTADEYTITIADLSGRKVHEEKVPISASTREVSINMQSEAAQLYIVTVRNSRNEVVATQKLAKH